MKLRRHIELVVLVLGLTGFSSVLRADMTFDINSAEFSGSGWDPQGTVTATFSNSIGGVNLTITAVNFTSQEFLDLISFNYDPNKNPLLLNITQNTGPTAAISTGVNFFQADGDGKFDVLFDFPEANSLRLNASNPTATFFIANVTEADFAFDSVQGGGNGTFFSAAHIGGIGANGNGSGWIGDADGGRTLSSVPEPSSVFLLGSAAVFAGLKLRNKLVKV